MVGAAARWVWGCSEVLETGAKVLAELIDKPDYQKRHPNRNNKTATNAVPEHSTKQWLLPQKAVFRILRVHPCLSVHPK